MKRIFIILTVCLFMIGCNKKESSFSYEKIASNEAIDIMRDNDYQIIDVRTKEEYDSGHIDNAINVLYTEVDNVSLSKDTVIFVYCASGKRSKIAAQSLLQMGYQVYDLGAYDTINID